MSDSVDNLVRMANQIADAFKASPRADAVESVANHIQSFWAPPLRRRLIEHAAIDHADLQPVAIDALKELERRQLAKAKVA